MAFSSRRDSRDEVCAGVGYEARRIFIESLSATASSCRPRSSSLSSRCSVWVKGIRGTKSTPEWAMKPDAFLSNPPQAPTPRFLSDRNAFISSLCSALSLWSTPFSLP
ncbi:hypothetical protein I3842_08G115800 [Carya illinoinensis]|uniref:Uncharacterized protein n=1 Tax=Carya illinoinensis TaxID=32201 RepID=A0A922ECG6_CARIL|nr:hypothetical protein I3842_08G115800 [Carya illinoinensis]